MKTLIELYDERPLENILSSEVFRPERTVFICPPETASNKSLQKKLKTFFKRRNVNTELIFISANMFSSADVLNKLQGIAKKYDDCAIDITGGTDASLFACGLFCKDSSVPVFTYSHKRNMFFNIANASFAEKFRCDTQYDIEDFFLMAGGSVRSGRVDNSVLNKYMDIIDPFFDFYLRHKSDWSKIISFMQGISPTPQNGEPVPVQVSGRYTVKGEHGKMVSANEKALSELQEIGMINNLQIVSGESVRFSFRDLQCRFWLRDVGSVLELYIYKACLEAGLFHDVRTSVIVDWEGTDDQNSVTNELDVMAARGVLPVFISCKTCDVKTEALNELAVLRDRFGGQGARAAIVTTSNGRGSMRHRATELDIDVIDIGDLRSGAFRKHIAALSKSR